VNFSFCKSRPTIVDSAVLDYDFHLLEYVRWFNIHYGHNQ